MSVRPVHSDRPCILSYVEQGNLQKGRTEMRNKIRAWFGGYRPQSYSVIRHLAGM